VKPSDRLERAWLNEEPARLYPSLHHPSGAERRFDEGAVRELVIKWQAGREPALLDEILRRCEPALTGTILARNGYTADFDEVLNTLRIRLWRKLPGFDPSRGRIFTFVSLIASQTLAEVKVRRFQQAQRFPEAGIEVLDCLQYSRSNGHDQAAALEDIRWRISQTRTTCTDPHELAAQRWLVRGQLDAEFKLRRHEVADAMTVVFGIPPTRSRQLYDATLLETRRTLLDVVEIPAITRRDLIGTRGTALGKYFDQLSPADFAKLAFLMHNLAPAIIPKHERIDLILDGFPGSRLLFT
jgi:hypothetical protein